MEVCGFSEEKVYDLNSTMDLILKEFSAAADPGYKVLPSLDAGEIASYFRTADQKGMIERLIHGILYPDAGKIPDGLVLTVYQMEYVTADLIALIMKEKENDQSGTI